MKPILFNTEMVRALLDNRKTMTRRVVKPQPVMYGFLETHFDWSKVKAPYHPGDILYVRETWGLYHQEPGFYVYKADEHIGAEFDGFKWHPSIHMPREAARIFLRVTNVRVERLQDISSQDIEREGIDLTDIKGLGCITRNEYVYAFQTIWDTTIKPEDRALYGWNANPWVWVIEFERCDKPKEEK